MAKFVFKLQSLLNVKSQMEENLKNELGKAVHKLEIEKQKKKEMEQEQETCYNNITSESSRGITVEKLREYNVYLSRLKEKIDFQKENINYAQSIVDNIRGELVKIVQEKKMIEKLKEKKYEEYNKEQLSIEQKLNDEIASYKYNESMTGENNGQG